MGIETIGIASLVMSAGSGLVSAIGTSNKDEAIAQADTYKAQVAKNNAAIAERKAQEEKEAGYQTAEMNDLRTRDALGKETVTQAGNGLDVNSGSNVSVRQSTADLGRLDTLTIINNAAKKARDFQVQAQNYGSEATLETMSAKYAQESEGLDVASSLLSSASSVSNKWLGFKEKGVL